jgi:hypothetical protein
MTPTGHTKLELAVVTLDEFAEKEEEGTAALVGDADGALLPEGGDVMFYGDGGAGKTTLSVDLACHLAAGDDWLGIRVARAARVLLVENEGPRPLFRAKLKRKRDAWDGSPLGNRLVVLEAPWGRLTFADAECRETLGAEIRSREIDVVIVGPVTRSGMNDAGTLQEVNDFMALVAHVRELSGRSVAFILVHHENKGGKVSGAWEASGDTLFHVSGQGRGRTRLYVQKARWSSALHATTLQLVWTAGEGFALEDAAELDDETIAERILAVVAANPGTGWTNVRSAVKGKGADNQTKDRVRDELLRSGRLVNVVRQAGAETAVDEVQPRSAARLYLREDPTIAHVCQPPGIAPAQAEPRSGRGADEPLCRVPRLIGGTGIEAQTVAPSEPKPA